MRINTNVSALNTQRRLSGTNELMAKSMARLSSGFRITRAADDAAGLAISNKLRADIRALRQASRNAEQAGSLVQVAEGAAQALQSIVERMKELSLQATSDNVDATGRSQIDEEFQALKNEITRIVDSTKFQGAALINGTYGNSVDTNVVNSTILDTATTKVASATISGTAASTYNFKVAADGKLTVSNTGGTLQQVVDIVAGAQTVNVSLFGITIETESTFVATLAGSQLNGAGKNLVVDAGTGGEFVVGASGTISDDKVTLANIDLTLSTLTLTGKDVLTDANAETALSAVDVAITKLNDAFATIGAAQNRLEYALSNVKTGIENYAAADSTIRDLDMAAEMTELTKFQILQQAGTAILAQANAGPQQVLQLFR